MLLSQKIDENNEHEQFIQLKLIDFGMAVQFKLDKKYKGRAGTPLYFAPEVIGGWYNHRVDVWSTGVTAFFLLTGKYPYFAPKIEVV